MEAMEATEALLTPREAARRLGYGVDHVRRMCRAGQLPAVRLRTGRWRVRWPAALEALAALGVAEGGAGDGAADGR